MLKINILSDRFATQNTCAFLGPLLVHGRAIRESGYDIRIHFAIEPALRECDVLVVNSNYFWNDPSQDRSDQATEVIAELADAASCLLFFDRSSTAASVAVDVLPFVTRYYKTSLLRDRAHYLRPLYGVRLFADYYHRQTGVSDEESNCSVPVSDAKHLAKLRLSWNTSLANYSLLGPRLATLCRYVPLAFLMRPTGHFEPPSASRPLGVSCRINTAYRRNTVAHQRKLMANLLGDYCSSDRIGKLAYVRELRRSRVVLSPFGYSEINYKDYETFLAGAVLMKPDMSHLETYPDLFQPETTFVPHSWDLDDTVRRLEEVLQDYDRYIDIARAGQEAYRAHIVGREARDRFVTYLSQLVTEALHEPRPQT